MEILDLSPLLKKNFIHFFLADFSLIFYLKQKFKFNKTYKVISYYWQMHSSCCCLFLGTVVQLLNLVILFRSFRMTQNFAELGSS